MRVLEFLVIAAFFAAVVAGSVPSEATDLASDVSAQRGQAAATARGARGQLLSRKGAVSFDELQAVDVGPASADRLDAQKFKKHRKRPSPGGLQGAGDMAAVGDRKMLRPPCVTEQDCVNKKLFCFKKCRGPMNLQEDPNCLMKCANCFPTC